MCYRILASRSSSVSYDSLKLLLRLSRIARLSQYLKSILECPCLVVADAVSSGRLSCSAINASTIGKLRSQSAIACLWFALYDLVRPMFW